MLWRKYRERMRHDPVSFYAGHVGTGAMLLLLGGIAGLITGARFPLGVVGVSLGVAGLVGLSHLGLLGAAVRGVRRDGASTYGDPRFGRLAGLATWLCFAALTLVGMVPADQLIPATGEFWTGIAGFWLQVGMWWSLMAAGAMGVGRVRRGDLGQGTAAAQFGLLAWALVTVAGIQLFVVGIGVGAVMVAGGGAMLAWHESALRRAGEAAAVGAYVPGAPAVEWSRRRSIADLVGLIVVVALLGTLNGFTYLSGVGIGFDTAAAPLALGVWWFVLFGLLVGALVFAGLKPAEAGAGEGQLA